MKLVDYLMMIVLLGTVAVPVVVFMVAYLASTYI